MNIAIVSNDYFAKNIDKIKNETAEHLGEATISMFVCNKGDNIMSALENFKPDLLITEDLAGFEMTTLMDSVAYNKIHAIQIHVISDTAMLSSPMHLKLLSKPLSLSMHFICHSEKEKECLLSLNPDIPYIHITSSDTLIPYNYILDILKST